MFSISGILALASVLKELFSLSKMLLQFIHEEEEIEERKKLAKDISGAIKEASQTGDTSKLEGIFGRSKSDAPPSAPSHS